MDALVQDADGGALGVDLRGQVEDTAVFESDSGHDRVAGMKLRPGVGVVGCELEFVLLVGAGERLGSEVEASELKAGDLI